MVQPVSVDPAFSSVDDNLILNQMTGLVRVKASVNNGATTPGVTTPG